jgi:hypothetical protein
MDKKNSVEGKKLTYPRLWSLILKEDRAVRSLEKKILKSKLWPCGPEDFGAEMWTSYRELYLKTQLVPYSKHNPSQL